MSRGAAAPSAGWILRPSSGPLMPWWAQASRQRISGYAAKAADGDFVYLDRVPAAVGHIEVSTCIQSGDSELLTWVNSRSVPRTHRARVLWMMSNRDTEEVRRLFPVNKIIRFTARRSVAAQNRRDVEQRTRRRRSFVSRLG